jgi:hypothetical protein
VSNFIVRRITAPAIAIALAAACSGCVAGGAAGVAATVVPMVAAGSAQVIGATAGAKDSGGIGGASKDDFDRCDQLLRVPPGVEEVRKTKDGVIESREWKAVETGGGGTWIMVRGKDSPHDAWQPKPGITRLLFDPPLYQMLKPEEPQYLAYAPADVVNVADSEQFDSMTSAFGPGVGTFKWHDRQYTYVLVKELPCFKPAKEK